MKPLRVAYHNPTGEADDIDALRRQPLYLGERDLLTHLHGVGSTRSGKSKWLEWFCRQLYREYAGFTLLDPQGALAEDLIGWLAVMVPETPVIYFEPNRSDVLVPFNPFRPVSEREDDPNYLTRVDVRAKAQAAATLRAWNMDGSEHTPRLSRWLYCIYYLFARGLVTFAEAGELLSLSGGALRDAVVARLGEAEAGVAAEWRDLSTLVKRPHDFYGQIESAKNRLFTFLNQPQIRRLFAQPGGLDFEWAFREHAVVICNLKPGEALHGEDARLLGSLIVSDLWSAVERYPKPPSPTPYFLLIDEVQKFVTPDLKEILDRGAGKGLRLGVFHQHLTQFAAEDPKTFASITTNAKIKLAFGGLSYDDARLMVNEMFTGQIDLKEVKHLVEQTKFWPVYDRERVRSRSVGHSRSEHEGGGTSSGASTGSATRFDPSTETFFDEPYVASENESFGEFDSYGSSTSESASEGEADVPIYRPVPFREASTVEFYSLEEQKEKLAGLLMNQYQRHLFLRVPGQGTHPALTPYVKERRLPPELERGEVLAQFILPYGVPVEALDVRPVQESSKSPDEPPEFAGTIIEP